METRTDHELLLEENKELHEQTSKINGLIKKDAFLSKAIISVGAPLIVAAVLALFLMWQNQIEFKSWIKAHESQAAVRIEQIEDNHREIQKLSAQISAIRSNQDLNEYKLDNINKSINKIYETLGDIYNCLTNQECQKSRMKGMGGMNGM